MSLKGLLWWRRHGPSLGSVPFKVIKKNNSNFKIFLKCNCKTFPSKGWCHSAECGRGLCLLLPVDVGPEPYWAPLHTVRWRFLSWVPLVWTPVGESDWLEFSGVTPPQETSHSHPGEVGCLHQPNSLTIGTSSQILSILTWFPAKAREPSSVLPLYPLPR